MKPAVALGWSLVLAVASAAADDGRAQLEQRVRLAARLIADSPTAQRITSSGNVQATNHYEESRVHQSLAEEALQRGDLAAARRAVDDALRHVGLARRLVPDMGGRQAAAKARQAQMRATLERLIQSWRDHAALTGPDGAIDGDLAAALGLMGTASYFADAGRYEESVHTLGTAEQHVLAGMKRVLQSREIDYTARAASPAEEVQIELQRHAALTDLVPLAVNELKPRGEAAALIERYGDASRALRTQALQHFQSGDVPAALAHIRNATLYLQRALQAAGLAMPNPTGSTP